MGLAQMEGGTGPNRLHTGGEGPIRSRTGRTGSANHKYRPRKRNRQGKKNSRRGKRTGAADRPRTIRARDQRKRHPPLNYDDRAKQNRTSGTYPL